MHPLIFSVVLLLTGFHPASPAAQDSGLPRESMDRLRAGEVLLENTRTDESGGAARVRALMYTSLEKIWEVLLSCERSFEYVDGLKACEIVEGGVAHALVRQSVKKSWATPRLDYTVEFNRQPFSLIEFHRTKGDLELLEGNWQFEALQGEDAVLVTHNIRVQPSFPVPRWLIRRSIRKDMPDMLACLRSLTGGSIDRDQRQSDNDRCPRAGRRGQGTL